MDVTEVIIQLNQRSISDKDSLYSALVLSLSTLQEMTQGGVDDPILVNSKETILNANLICCSGIIYTRTVPVIRDITVSQ